METSGTRVGRPGAWNRMGRHGSFRLTEQPSPSGGTPIRSLPLEEAIAEEKRPSALDRLPEHRLVKGFFGPRVDLRQPLLAGLRDHRDLRPGPPGLLCDRRTRLRREVRRSAPRIVAAAGGLGQDTGGTAANTAEGERIRLQGPRNRAVRPDVGHRERGLGRL